MLDVWTLVEEVDDVVDEEVVEGKNVTVGLEDVEDVIEEEPSIVVLVDVEPVEADIVGEVVGACVVGEVVVKTVGSSVDNDVRDVEETVAEDMGVLLELADEAVED